MRARQGGIGTLVIIILVALVVIYIGNNYTGSFLNSTSKTSISAPSSMQQSQPVRITYDNLIPALSSNPIVQALPSNGIILLKFYNFNTGQRQWEKSYVLTKASAKEGTSPSPDITFSLHSKYLSQLTNQNFCGIIQAANKNGDLGTELGISKISLMWKYRSVMSYRSCLGF